MDVDISKIKPGDRVTVEGIVLNDDLWHRPGYTLQRVRFSAGIEAFDCFVIQGSIKTHTPAPREIKVGDRVCAHNDREAFDVIGVDGNSVWLKNSAGYRMDIEAERVRHAEPAP